MYQDIKLMIFNCFRIGSFLFFQIVSLSWKKTSVESGGPKKLICVHGIVDDCIIRYFKELNILCFSCKQSSFFICKFYSQGGVSLTNCVPDKDLLHGKLPSTITCCWQILKWQRNNHEQIQIERLILTFKLIFRRGSKLLRPTNSTKD